MTYIEKIQINKKNKLAGLHPGTKMWVIILYTICAFVLGSIDVTRYGLALGLIPWFFVVLALCVASGDVKKCIGGLKTVGFVALVIFVAQAFLIPGGEILWQAGFLKIHQHGLQSAISLSFTVLDVAGIFVWVLQTTSNKEIARALEESGMNYKVAYVFSSTLQMIDVLGDNSKVIMDAQRARGIETEGNLLVRAKAFFPTLVPLILGAVIGSEERVLTLEARGFSMTCEKTHLFNLQKSGLEGTVKVTGVIITVLIIAGRVALWLL